MNEAKIFDPSVLHHLKLSIGDILNAVPFETKSSIYVINGNQVKSVDVIANICNVYDMDRLFKVYLTDGTGFIPCTIWKKESSFPNDLTGLTDSMSTDEELLVKSLHRTLNLRENYAPQVGQNIHIRGRITSYLDQKEITAFYYRLVVNSREPDNRLVEVKELHSKLYNQFWSTKSEYCINESLRLRKVVNIKELIIAYLEKYSLSTFSIGDLCLVDDLVHSVKSIDSDNLLGKSLRNKISVVIDDMLKDGVIFLSELVVANSQYYHVAKRCTKLQLEVRRHMKKLSETTPATEFGVSSLSLLKDLNKTEEFKHLTTESLKIALDLYEETGLIYGCANKQYRLV